MTAIRGMAAATLAALLSATLLAACADSPTRSSGGTAAAAPRQEPHNPTGNYCFTRPDGKKTWSSFILRDNVLKVSPRARDARVAFYVPAGGRSWRDRDGPGTYTFAQDGTALWQANNGSGDPVDLRPC